MSNYYRRLNDPSVPQTIGKLGEMIKRNENNQNNKNNQKESIFDSQFSIFSPYGQVNGMIDKVQRKTREQPPIGESKGTLIGGKRHSKRRNKRTFRKKSQKNRQLFTRRKKRHNTL